MAEKKYLCENLGIRQAISLNSHIRAAFPSQCETLMFAGNLLGTSVNNKHVPDSFFIPVL